MLRLSQSFLEANVLVYLCFVVALVISTSLAKVFWFSILLLQVSLALALDFSVYLQQFLLVCVGTAALAAPASVSEFDAGLRPPHEKHVFYFVSLLPNPFLFQLAT